MLSNLTAEQRNSLQAMPQVLGLAADIAHAAEPDSAGER